MEDLIVTEPFVVLAMSVYSFKKADSYHLNGPALQEVGIAYILEVQRLPICQA